MTINNNTPRVILNGIKDESVLPLVPESEQIPIHLPLIYVQTERGPVEPVLVMAGDYTRIYGDASIDPRLPFFNHATLMAMTVLGEGNSVLIKRIISATAKCASLTLIATVDKTAGIINHYARNPDGTVIEGINGDPTFVSPAVPVPGGAKVKFSWVPTSTYNLPQLNSSGNIIGYDTFPTFQSYMWATTNGVANPNIITYPILTADASSIGAFGNNVGLRLWKANSLSSTPADIDIINDQESLIYSAQLVERASNNTTIIQESLYNAKSLEFTLKPNTYNYKTNVNLDIQGLITMWGNDGIQSGQSPIYGPLSAITFHSNFIDTILDELLIVENTILPQPTTKWMMDLFSGTDVNDIHHYGFQIDTTGARISEGRTQYLVEGADGDLSLSAFNASVGNEIDFNYQNSDYPLVDAAEYPFSAIYDSGYPIPIKKKFFKWTSYRKDVHVAVATHVAGQAVLSVEDEISVATDLRSSAAVYAESDVQGTGVCRVVIVGHSGVLINNSYTDRVSVIFDLAAKRARYLGAGNGKMKNGLGYDNAPYNQVTTMKDINNTYLTQSGKDAVWNAGINFVEHFDRRTLFFPGLQTVYAIKNSVLTSEMMMQICVDVTKQCDITWKLLTGNTQLTRPQFIDRSNAILAKLVEGRYDDRVTIVPRTYFTPGDVARGYSWTMDVAVYSNIMKSVGTMNVISRQTEQQVTKL